MRIVVFGAGGRAGRRVAEEAAARGHQVTAVVRDPAKHPGTTAGDVTDADSVAAVSAGHDVAVNAAARLDVPAVEFYGSATAALLDGLKRAGVGRLVLVGIGSMLETEAGVPLYEAPDVSAEARAFTLGHVAELAALRESGTAIDWLVVAPPPTMLDDDAPRTGEYRTGGSTAMAGDGREFAYADLAVALVDQVENPAAHRAMISVGY